MSVTQNTLIGRTRGSIGGVTFSTWKGLNIAKSKPTSVANPNTPGQQEARSILSNAVNVYRQIAALISVGFLQMAVGKSAFNAFVSENIKNGSFTGADLEKISVPANFVSSKGTLTNQAFTIDSADVSDNSVIVSWEGPNTGDQLGTDTAFGLLVGPTGIIMGTSLGTATRTNGSFTIAPTNPLVASSVYTMYVFFYQSATRKVSDSVTETIVAVA